MKKILIVLLVALSLSFPTFAFAEKIVLKSGETVEGTIVQRNDLNIKVNVRGDTLPYYYSEIESIDGQKVTSTLVQPGENTPGAVSSNEVTEQVKPAALTPVDSKRTCGRPIGMSKNIIIGALFLLLLIYIYGCLCLQLIALKTGTQNSWFAWVPILNIILLCDIAEKPRWWAALYLLGIIPYLGSLATLVVTALLNMKIAERRGKPQWVGLICVIPFIGIIPWSYLAFSNGTTQEGGFEGSEEKEKKGVD